MTSTTDIQNFTGKYPPQLWSLFFSEMWERFCFYGMRGVLILFMVEQLVLDEVTANLQYGATQAFVYAFTFIGGLFADKILGYRKSLFWGGILMILGSVLLMIDPKKLFFLGIAFTIIGTGFFKPNISTMVGSLYRDGDSRRDAGFSLFYAGINIGALIGGYVCVATGKGELFSSIIPEALRWNAAFGFASVVMVISLITFLLSKRSLGSIGLSPLQHLNSKGRLTRELITYLGSLLVIPVIMVMVSETQYTNYFMYTIGPCTLLYLFYEMRVLNSQQRSKLFAALVFIIFSIFFWSFFEQSGGSLSLFAASHLSDSIFGVPLDPNGVNNSANSLFVILFAALVGLVWVGLARRKQEPHALVKFSLAFIFLGLGFYLFYSTRFFADAKAVSPLGLFTTGWLVITFGELCLSPIGMSLMTQLAPQKLQAVMMGMWFLASAYGQYFAGILGAGISEAALDASPIERLNVYTQGYQQLGLYALLCGAVMLLLYKPVKSWMG